MSTKSTRTRRKVERHDPNDPFCRIPKGMQRCNDCRAILPEKKFIRNKSAPNGCGPLCLHCHRIKDLKKKYGSDVIEWMYEQLAKQHGKCAACGSPNSRHGSGKWLVDHDPVTGMRRAVICNPCNLHRGWLEKGWNMDAAAKYFNEADARNHRRDPGVRREMVPLGIEGRREGREGACYTDMQGGDNHLEKSCDQEAGAIDSGRASGGIGASELPAHEGGDERAGRIPGGYDTG